MSEIYLDKNIKEAYRADFNNNVLTENDSFWKLSEILKSYLIHLNSIENIQPLYSKFPDNLNSFTNNESYLTIAYTENIELKLFREVLPYFVIRFNNLEESKFYFTFSGPKDNANYSDEETKFRMACLTDPNYFRINHLQFNFTCSNIEMHKNFWSELVTTLKELDK